LRKIVEEVLNLYSGKRRGKEEGPPIFPISTRGRRFGKFSIEAILQYCCVKKEEGEENGNGLSPPPGKSKKSSYALPRSQKGGVQTLRAVNREKEKRKERKGISCLSNPLF